MAGLVPAIHVFDKAHTLRRGCLASVREANAALRAAMAGHDVLGFTNKL